MIKLKPLSAAVLVLVAAAASSASMAGDVDDRIAELERQLEALKQQVSSNQEEIVVNKEEIEQARPSRKGTRFQYGGYIQLDAIASDYSDGKPTFYASDDLLVASTIPVEPENGKSDAYSSTNLHAKSSRFWFTTDTNTDAGKIATRIELDFILSGSGDTPSVDERISNSWSSRVRHAFVTWEYDEGKSLLAGQTWSTFFNVAALPDLLDFVGPVGTLFNRQPQIRWTMGGLQLALENPATKLANFPYDNSAEGMPDLVARYNGKAGDLSWSVAGIARELTYEDRTNPALDGGSDEQYGYGLSLAGKWMLGQDDLRIMLNYGDALGRYMGLNAFTDGYVDENGNIETIDQLGGFIAYRHFWSPKWRSTFSLSAAEADNPGDAGNLARKYQTVHLNLNYLPTPTMSIGGEYIYAKKELEDGRDGDLNRLQFAVKYVF